MLFLFSCPHCGLTPSYRTFPLCETCLDSLVPAPPLCNSCGSPHCNWKDCASLANANGINGYFAAYLLTDPGYGVLKSWKKKKGPSFSNLILHFAQLDPESRLSDLHRRLPLDAIVPVPQSFERAWQLQGSPALEIAQSLSLSLKIPVVEILKPRIGARKRRQAELSMTERMGNQLRYDLKENQPKPSRVLLVDDFKTTGSTLRSAALSLRLAGVSQIFAFCLGVRPQRLHLASSHHTEQRPYLLEGA